MVTFWSPFGFVLMSVGLLLSVSLGASTETKSIFLGSMFAAPFMFALAKPEVVQPSGKLDFLFLLEPALVLIVVCSILFGMFGLSRVYACESRSIDSN